MGIIEGLAPFSIKDSIPNFGPESRKECFQSTEVSRTATLSIFNFCPDVVNKFYLIMLNGKPLLVSILGKIQHLSSIIIFSAMLSRLRRLPIFLGENTLRTISSLNKSGQPPYLMEQFRTSATARSEAKCFRFLDCTTSVTLDLLVSIQDKSNLTTSTLTTEISLSEKLELAHQNPIPFHIPD